MDWIHLVLQDAQYILYVTKKLWAYTTKPVIPAVPSNIHSVKRAKHINIGDVFQGLFCAHKPIL